MKTTSVQQDASAVSNGRASRFRLGPVDVDPQSGTVSGPGGRQVLDPKVMAVLSRLAREPGHVVTREVLMQDVWGEQVVTDFALSRCIYQLRKQLAAVGRMEESAIQTLPKRGYRLSWPVHTISRKRLRSDAGFAFASIVAIVSLISVSLSTHWNSSTDESLPGDELRLVVYPFDDLSDARDQHVFAAGLGREIQHRLAALRGLTLIGRTSAFDPQNQATDGLEHAGRLDASYLLDGSVQTVGHARRVLVDLHTVPAGELVWSREFVIDRDARFDVVQDVANEIVTRFRFSADAEYASHTTSSLDAFESYLSAFEAGSRDLTRQALLRAVELDPNFAQAWNALAAMEVYPVWNGLQTVEDAWAIAQPFIDRALEVNPDLPDIYITLGRFKRDFGDYDAAIEQFEKALELDPGNPAALANLGIVLRPAGRYEQALQVHQLAVSLDPLDALAQTRLGTSHWLMENHEEAARHYAIAAELMPDNEEIYDSWSAMLSLGMGRFDDGLEKLDRKMRLEHEPTPRTLTSAGEIASALGLRELAERYFDEAEVSAPSGQVLLSTLATHYLIIGDDTTAKSLAEQALKHSPADIEALLIMGTFDIESGRPERFFERVRRAYPDTLASDELEQGDIREMLLVASACAATGRQESADRLAQAVIDRVGRPRAYQHLWLAAAHALRRDPAAALQELRDSPPGWIRKQAALLPRDPRFVQLWDLPQFHDLVRAHQAELARQRDAYLSRAVVIADSNR